MRAASLAGALAWASTCVALDGAFNPKDYPECKKNPSADVSAIPLASLPGKEAGAGETAKPTAVAKSGGIAIGAYECWAYGRARMMLNLAIQSGNRYLDSQGRPGTFALNAADGRVTFRGGMWEGALPAGTHVRYEERRGAPVLSIRGADGGEISFCEGK